MFAMSELASISVGTVAELDEFLAKLRFFFKRYVRVRKRNLFWNETGRVLGRDGVAALFCEGQGKAGVSGHDRVILKFIG